MTSDATQLLAFLREQGAEGGRLPPFAWPGGYLIVYLTAEGLTICADCANKDPSEWSDPVVGAGIEYEPTEAETCEDCGRPLDPAERATPGQAPATDPVTAARCTHPRHEHHTTDDCRGGTLAEPRPMVCAHDREPAHYDHAVQDYRHDNPATTCFLIPDNTGGTPCTTDTDAENTDA